MPKKVDSPKSFVKQHEQKAQIPKSQPNTSIEKQTTNNPEIKKVVRTQSRNANKIISKSQTASRYGGL